MRISASLEAVGLLPALAGCEATSFSGAPPTVVCGTTLSSSASGATVEDATVRHGPIRNLTDGGLLFVVVSDDCAHGARVTWSPASAASLVRQAPARDGLPAAVVLKPAGPTAAFRLSAVRDGRTVAETVVQLG